MDCNPPGFSVHGIFQERTLQVVAFSSPREHNRRQEKKARESIRESEDCSLGIIPSEENKAEKVKR